MWLKKKKNCIVTTAPPPAVSPPLFKQSQPAHARQTKCVIDSSLPITEELYSLIVSALPFLSWKSFLCSSTYLPGMRSRSNRSKIAATVNCHAEGLDAETHFVQKD